MNDNRLIRLSFLGNHLIFFIKSKPVDKAAGDPVIGGAVA